MAPIPHPVAIVTGGASGIGLGLTKHLQSKGYAVFMADVSPKGSEVAASLAPSPSHSSADPSQVAPAPFYIQTDVSSWSSQAAMFKTVYSKTGRIDFLAANAGIADTEDIHLVGDLDSEPKELDVTCMNVDLIAVWYGLKLFVHYAHLHRRDVQRAGGDVNAIPQKKVVATASMVGIYPFVINPQYCSAKHGVVGMVRAAGPRFLREDNITLNAIMPHVIHTNIGSAELFKPYYDRGLVTPMSRVMEAYDAFLHDDQKSGETVEVAVKQLYFREPVAFADDHAKYIMEDPDEIYEGFYQIIRKVRVEAIEAGKAEKDVKS